MVELASTMYFLTQISILCQKAVCMCVFTYILLRCGEGKCSNFLCVCLDRSKRWKASCFPWNSIFLSTVELLLYLSVIDFFFLYGLNSVEQNQKISLCSSFPLNSTRCSDSFSSPVGGFSGTGHSFLSLSLGPGHLGQLNQTAIPDPIPISSSFLPTACLVLVRQRANERKRKQGLILILLSIYDLPHLPFLCRF